MLGEDRSTHSEEMLPLGTSCRPAREERELGFRRDGRLIWKILDPYAVFSVLFRLLFFVLMTEVPLYTT